MVRGDQKCHLYADFLSSPLQSQLTASCCSILYPLFCSREEKIKVEKEQEAESTVVKEGCLQRTCHCAWPLPLALCALLPSENQANFWMFVRYVCCPVLLLAPTHSSRCLNVRSVGQIHCRKKQAARNTITKEVTVGHDCQVGKYCFTK